MEGRGRGLKGGGVETRGEGVKVREGRRRSLSTCLLQLVGDDAAHEVGVSRVQVLHQLVQLLLSNHRQVTSEQRIQLKKNHSKCPKISP